jgi:competence protein ComEA
MPRLLQLSLAFLSGIVLLLLGQVAWQRVIKTDRPASKVKASLDINRASRAELQQLDGIGPVRAERVVTDREKHGRFASVDDVQRVSGIGPKTLERLRPNLEVDRTSEAAAMSKPPRSLHGKGAVIQPFDLNRATREQLIGLDGVGPVLADRILAHRQTHGPFRAVSDLMQIKGIKTKMLEKLRPFVFVEEEKAAGKGRPDA